MLPSEVKKINSMLFFLTHVYSFQHFRPGRVSVDADTRKSSHDNGFVMTGLTYSRRKKADDRPSNMGTPTIEAPTAPATSGEV